MRSEAITGDVDLSGEGTIDWVHWGESAARNHKNLGTEIGEYRITPPDLTAEYDDKNTTVFSWTGGSPKETESGTKRYSYLNDRPDIRAVVPIAAQVGTLRTARLYLGGKGTRVSFEASLTDGSAPAPPRIEISNEATFLVRLVVTYAAKTPGASLEVKGSVLERFTDDGSLRIAAVTLR